MTEPSLKSGISVWTARLERLSAWSAGAFLVLMIADILMGVFFRYFLHSSVIWTEEVARFSLVWLVMLGACAAFIHGDHMAIDFIINRMNPSVQKAVALARLIVSFMVLALMISLGLNNAINMWNMQTMALNIPKTIPLLSLPAGFLLLLAAIVLTHLPEVAGRKKEASL